MAETAFAASMSGIAMRTMSAPAACMARICWTVASTSQVLVEHMVCTLTGALPPTATLPTRICFVWFLSLMAFSPGNSLYSEKDAI